MAMDEQAYPLCPDFDLGGQDMSIPLRVNYAGYYYNKSVGKHELRQLQSWYLAITNYRQNPGSDKKAMEVGQFVLRKPDIPSPRYLPANETTGYYWIYFTGNKAEQLLADCNLEPDRVYTVQEECMKELRQDFTLLFQEASSKRPGYQKMLVSVLVTILVRLSRSVCSNQTEKDDRLSRQLEKSLLYIQGNFSDSSLTVAKLADKIHLSQSRYRALFRKSFGISPCEYIIQQRLAHACELLKNTSHNISKIANYCGYQDTAYFCRLFRKKIGSTPSEYRSNSTAR